MLAAAPAWAQRMQSIVPDTVFHNATVVTVDAEDNVSEAFAVRGDRFLAVGTDALPVHGVVGPAQCRAVGPPRQRLRSAPSAAARQ
mgnify:CR=1 FL=1